MRSVSERVGAGEGAARFSQTRPASAGPARDGAVATRPTIYEPQVTRDVIIENTVVWTLQAAVGRVAAAPGAITAGGRARAAAIADTASKATQYAALTGVR